MVVKQTQKPSKNITLTDRDRAVLYNVYTHRFMTALQIQKVVNPKWNLTNCKNRLTALYRLQYLARPAAQFGEFVEGGGSKPLVYALGREGKKVLMQAPYSLSLKSMNIVSNNSKVNRPHIKHTLMTTEVVANARVACRAHGIHFIDESPLIQNVTHTDRKNGTFRSRSWPVPAYPPLTTEASRIIPDRMFCFEFPDRAPGKNRLYFFLESDRGSENHVSNTTNKATLARKMRQYRATAKTRTLQEHFPAIESFTVLVVGNTRQRVANMVETSKSVEGGWNKLLFTDLTTVEKSPFFSIPWVTGKTGEVMTLGGAIGQ